jgi:hypothetical protein
MKRERYTLFAVRNVCKDLWVMPDGQYTNLARLAHLRDSKAAAARDVDKRQSDTGDLFVVDRVTLTVTLGDKQ